MLLLGRQKKVDLCEFEANQVYKASSGTDRKVTQRNCEKRKEDTERKKATKKERKKEAKKGRKLVLHFCESQIKSFGANY